MSKFVIVSLAALLASGFLLSQPLILHSDTQTSAHAETSDFDYPVVEGDTLSGIAAHFYGAAHYYPQIAAKNQLSDADFLPIGQHLTLDLEPKAEKKTILLVMETVFNATGYSCSQEEGTSHFTNGVEVCNQTASGTLPSWGTIAVDPNVISLGTRVEIREFPGTTFIAQDTGGAIVGRKIDIWFPTVSEALNFGVSQVHLTVLN